MPHNENSRVKIPALVHFTRLGYKYISLRKYEGVIDDDTNILVDVLCDAINRINATSLTTTDVQKIVNALKAMLENDDLGREFYSVLINGYNGLKLIDFEDFGGTVNSYHVVTEMTCKNGSDEFRPDITPLINGIPLAFIEVKKPNNKGGIKAEYDRMLMRVKNKKFRRFINLTQIMVFSNNSEYDDTEAVPLEGAFYSTISYEKLFFSHFREEDEKLLTSVPEKDEAVENFILTDNNLSSIKYSPEYVTNSSPVSPTNRIITSLFSFERILTFLKYAIAYVERTDENGITHLEKHLMRYPQFFATKASVYFTVEIDALLDELEVLCCYGLDYIGNDGGKTQVGFNINRTKPYSSDEERTTMEHIVPFQIAYAVSIHKAQGLEYDSVKIVIADETEDQITHNIFYTAITRAKQHLTIYWSPEVCNRILARIRPVNYKRDFQLLKAKNNL